MKSIFILIFPFLFIYSHWLIKKPIRIISVFPSMNVLSHFFEYPLGNTWRSEDMTLIQIVMQKESGHETVSRLMNLDCVQFKDVNNFNFTKQ